MAPTECYCHLTPNSNFLTRILFFSSWRISVNISNVLSVPFKEKYALSTLTTIARNLLFWNVQIKHCLSVFDNHFLLTDALREFDLDNSLRVMRLNDDKDRPIPFHCVLTFALFFNNVHSLSTFFYQFLLIDFS